MIVATNRFQVRSGSGPQLEERFAQGGGLEQTPGFVSFQMWRSKTEREHDEYLVVTIWESQDALDGWVASDSFKRSHGGAPLDFIVGSSGESYEVMLSSTASEPRPSEPPR